MKELLSIQSELKAPKSQRNNFGKYNYRSCEDILEAVKPLLKKTKCTLTISDDIILVGERYYIQATVTLTNEEGECATAKAFAREADNKAGMDVSQITGSSSSYARKYALNGLFAIDDTKDADATNTHDTTKPAKPQQPSVAPAPPSTDPVFDELNIIAELNKLSTIKELANYSSQLQSQGRWNDKIKAHFTNRKNAIQNATQQTK